MSNDPEMDEFVVTFRTQLEIFVNRLKSNQSRGRPIANDTAVQSLFVNITAMHGQLLQHLQHQEKRRGGQLFQHQAGAHVKGTVRGESLFDLKFAQVHYSSLFHHAVSTPIV